MTCLMCAELVVCQLTVVKPVGQTVGRLYLTRFQSGLPPLIICLPGFETAEVPVSHSCLMVVTHSQETCARNLHKFLASNFRASSSKFG